MTVSKNKQLTTDKTKSRDSAIEFQITNSTKAADGSVSIEGYANTVDRDRVGDIVLPEAFKATLPEYLKNPILLYMHNWERPIGTVVEAKIDERGLWIRASISNAAIVADIRTQISEGILKTFSIGYNELDSDFDKKTETRIIRQLELLEISIVTIPANPAALFTQSQGGAGEGKSAPQTAENLKGEPMKTKQDGTPEAGETPSVDLAPVLAAIDGIKAAIETMTGKMDALMATVESMKAQPKAEDKPEVCAGCGKPKAECTCKPEGSEAPKSAPAGQTKENADLDSMTDEAALQELEQLEKELSAIE